MQAIILAAGMGKRLGVLTQNNTKCMVKVNGITLIDRMLSQLSKLKLKRVVIVVGYEGQKLVDYIGDRYDSFLKIEYVFNPIFDKTNNIYSLALAKEQLQSDDTLLLESDLIFEDSLLDMVVSHSYPNLALVAKYEPWMDGTMVRITEKNDILSFVSKTAFRYEDIGDYYKTVNIYKFSQEFSKEQYVPFLEAYCKAMGNNEYYEQVLRVLTLLDKAGLKALPIGTKKWYEIDDVQDLDIAEALFSEGDDKLKKLSMRFGGYWRFPKMLDFCYLVNPFFPSVQMKKEMISNFDTLLTEYPSGMRVNSLLGGKYFGINSDYVVVGNGAAELIKAMMENHIQGKLGIILPTFEEYPNRLDDRRIVSYCPKNQNYTYTARDIYSYFSNKDVDSILIINPDNPSGNYIAIKDVLGLAKWCKERDIRLIVDESFVDFTDGYRDNSLLHNSILETHPNLVVVKSISKSYGVPGLRLGVIASSDKKLICELKKEVAIWNINSFAEFYMQIFSKYESKYFEACNAFIEERMWFSFELGKIPWLRVIPSQANYFLCEVYKPYTSSELTKILLVKHNILIKDCSSKKGFEGGSYIRIAIRDRKDNIELLNVLNSLDKSM